MIENGKKVKFTFTAKLDDDNILEFSTNEIEMGNNEILPIFTEAMVGKEVGDKIYLSHKLYGERDDTRVAIVERAKLPENIEVNQIVTTIDKNNPNHKHRLTITEIKEEGVSLDLNHPYAGKLIHCELEILDIN